MAFISRGHVPAQGSTSGCGVEGKRNDLKSGAARQKIDKLPEGVCLDHFSKLSLGLLYPS